MSRICHRVGQSPGHRPRPAGQPLPSVDMATAEQQLQGFIAKYSREIAATAKHVRADLRQRMVGTIEMVYDNYNALVMAYSSTGKVSDVICSIALYPRW